MNRACVWESCPYISAGETGEKKIVKENERIITIDDSFRHFLLSCSCFGLNGKPFWRSSGAEKVETITAVLWSSK